MSDPFVGEIRMFAGNFAPQGWAFCDGQLVAIAQNDALFSLFGTIYGGDGRTTFGLPECRGRIPLHMGSGPGLTPRAIGAHGGFETSQLNASQLPVHNHGPMQCTADAANQQGAGGRIFAQSGSADVYRDDDFDGFLSGDAVTAVGGGQPHENMQPFLCINFIVSLYGIYPSRQ